jgi:catechol-2,3-dioxygenase
MLITRLELLTSSLIRLREFYTNILELPAYLENDSLHVQAGKTDLIFKQEDDFQGAYHFCFNIPENKFVECKAWTLAKIPLLKDDKGNDEFTGDAWNSSSIYFKDSAGNILEFIARHNQKNATQESFNNQQILQISEIGLPSKDVISFAKELCSKLGIEVYKQDFNETFTPIGDEDGLLILPIENRIWYPNTSVPAKLLDVKVDLEVNGKKFHISGVPYEILGVSYNLV